MILWEDEMGAGDPVILAVLEQEIEKAMNFSRYTADEEDEK